MKEMQYRVVWIKEDKIEVQKPKENGCKGLFGLIFDRYCYITGRSQRSSKMYEKLTTFLINFEGVKEVSALRVPFPELRGL
jgi:hypothetical protein